MALAPPDLPPPVTQGRSRRRRVRQWLTVRRAALAVWLILAAALWYVLVPSPWSLALIIGAVFGFIVIEGSRRLRKTIESVIPEQFGAHRALFILLFALAGYLVYTQAEHYGHVDSPPRYFSPPTVEFGAPHAVPAASPIESSHTKSREKNEATPKPTTYFYKVTVDPNSCTNPALVTVRLFVQPRSIPLSGQPRRMHLGRIFLSVADAHSRGGPSSVRDVTVPERGKYGGRELGLVVKRNYPRVFRSKGEFAHYLQPGTIISADAGYWPMSDINPVIFRFKADWVRHRAVGTCYVVLPTGQKDAGDPSKWAQPVASYVNVVPGRHERRGIVMISASSSEPDDPLVPQWRCSLSVRGRHDDCSGYAVYARAGEIDHASDGVLKFAALLGVCLAIVVELIIQPFCERRRS